MNDHQLNQFSRQILLDGWGIEAQQRVINSRVLIVGAGGLGHGLSQHLVRAGVSITLVDPDRVDLSNLSRQWFSADDVGRPKVEAAARLLSGLGSVDAQVLAFDDNNAGRFSDHDLWIDASDNLATRLCMHHAARRHGLPWIMGTALMWSGQCAAFAPGAPCFECVFGHIREPAQQCDTSGVLGPVVNQVATTQALWALSYLGAVAALPVGRLRRWDGPHGDVMDLSFTHREHCDCRSSAHNP
ncbi:HesA/MoeB/ThiF family protein [Litorivicinus lipolyticus]|uniref:HesA/MoeB/ThiF family protein n=1 Tax=Litorivicinus lipolyticus TaxID=418701 RepID=UPI003B5B6F7E